MQSLQRKKYRIVKRSLVNDEMLCCVKRQKKKIKKKKKKKKNEKNIPPLCFTVAT